MKMSWHLMLVLGLGLTVAACCGGGEGGGSEGPVVPPPPAPAEYADKHMPAEIGRAHV